MRSRRDFFVWAAVVLLLGLGALGSSSVRPGCVLFVGDSGDNTIKAYDATAGTFLGSSDAPALSGLAGPRGIIIKGGELLVVNQNVDTAFSGEVLRFSATGTFLGAVVAASNPDAPFAPFGMVLGDQNELLIGNLMRKDRSSPGRVTQFDSATGVFLGEATVKGSEHHPRGVVVGPDGSLYVAARDLKGGLGGSVFRLDKKNGKAELFIDDKGGIGRLNRPDGLAFGPDGHLYVTSFRARAIQFFNLPRNLNSSRGWRESP